MDQLVKAQRNVACRATENELATIFDFFERLRDKKGEAEQMRHDALHKASQPQPFSKRRLLFSLPKTQYTAVRDWYVPCYGSAIKPTRYYDYFIDSEADERQLYEHLVKLLSAGIPSFLGWVPLNEFRKPFVSLEAYLSEQLVAKNPVAVLAAVREKMVERVATAVVSAALQFFGEKVAWNLIAIFDASGKSDCVTRWKISLRIVLCELAVTHSNNMLFGKQVVRMLSEATDLQEPWIQAIEAMDEKGTCKNAATPGFWDTVIDKRAFKPDAFHRLVWCDTIHSKVETPERRPLRPHSLMHAHGVVSSGGGAFSNIRLQRLDLAHELQPTDWITLGAIWTTQPETPFANRNGYNNGSMYALPPSNTPEFVQYVTEDGKPYYYNIQTEQTTWEKPVGQIRQADTLQRTTAQQQPIAAHQCPDPQLWRTYYDPKGTPYYHCPLTRETRWDQPDPSQLFHGTLS